MSDRQISIRTKARVWIFPLYPFFFGIYPVLALLAFNISEVDPYLSYRAVFLSIVFALFLFGLLRLLLRDWSRAAFLSLLLLILFFSYGHVYNLIKTTSVFGFALGRHRLLAPLWAVLAGLAIWISTRRSTRFSTLTTGLNIISAVLLILPIFQITSYELANRRLHPATPSASASTSSPSTHSPYPDIYYIIPDAHGRTDKIQEVYGYDNSAFIQALTQRGFYIANCSQSNYPYTKSSLASSLNMDYIDKFAAPNNAALDQSIQNAAVRQFLKAHGYTIVAFETGFRWTQWEDADIYYRYRPAASLLNGFEYLYLQTTLLHLPMDYLNTSNLPQSDDSLHYHRILYNLGIMKNLAGSVKSPKFVFAHLVVPHPPYVFGPNGEYVTQGADDINNIPGYRNAVAYIDQAILQVVDQILANSKAPPIIVIQGDHGPFFYSQPVQHMAILNAYYLPGAPNSLYPSITPVNTFRIIFNAYFGQKYPLLQDQSWYAAFDNRYTFNLIPNNCGN